MADETLTQLAQDKIAEETKNRQVYQIKSRLEKIASLNKQIANLNAEIAKIEVAPLDETPNCYNSSVSTLNIYPSSSF